MAQTHRYILNITNPTTFLYYQMMNDLSNNVCEVLKGYLVFFSPFMSEWNLKKGSVFTVFAQKETSKIISPA